MAAANILNEKKLFPIKITPASSVNLLGDVAFLNKVSPKSRVIFTRQLATLVKAGLPITQALNTSIDQVNDKKFKSKLEKIAASVEGGQTLSESFAQYPDTFNEVYVSPARKRTANSQQRARCAYLPGPSTRDYYRRYGFYARQCHAANSRPVQRARQATAYCDPNNLGGFWLCG
jgi:hypothetical protein